MVVEPSLPSRRSRTFSCAMSLVPRFPARFIVWIFLRTRRNRDNPEIGRMNRVEELRSRTGGTCLFRRNHGKSGGRIAPRSWTRFGNNSVLQIVRIRERRAHSRKASTSKVVVQITTFWELTPHSKQRKFKPRVVGQPDQPPTRSRLQAVRFPTGRGVSLMRRSPPRCASFRLAQSGFGAEPASMQRLTDCFHYSPVRPEFLVSYWEKFRPELAPRNGVSP